MLNHLVGTSELARGLGGRASLIIASSLENAFSLVLALVARPGFFSRGTGTARLETPAVWRACRNAAKITSHPNWAAPDEYGLKNRETRPPPWLSRSCCFALEDLPTVGLF